MREKIVGAREIFLLIFPIKTITKHNFYVRENKNHTREKKNKKCPWETHNVREKKNPSVKKNLKKSKKWLSRALLIFTGKKNNTA